MKKYDVHIHSCWASSDCFDAKDVLAKLEKVGFYGGAVFSEAPSSMHNNHGSDGRRRLNTLLKAVEGCGDRLLPLLWIHPDEDGVVDLVAEAAERGVVGFKVICNNFYVYEDKSVRMLEAAAKAGKPVMFHSGILWDDTESSKYNRPLHWERLCTIPNLRFSLAHCSWPWYDECLALYGKFLTNRAKHPELGNEMFFDMTPGTPPPYRKDLYNKLLNSGYDVSHNMLWGTDCNTDDYACEWTAKWDRTDNAIMDELGTPDSVRELIFHKNAERFFHLTDETYIPKAPSCDGR